MLAQAVVAAPAGLRGPARAWRILLGLLTPLMVLLSGCQSEVVHVGAPANPRAWLITGSLGLILLALALRRSARQQKGAPDRFIPAVAAGLGLYMIGRPCAAYYQVHHDLPWAVLGPVLGVLMVAGWLGRQRWVSLVAALPLLFLAAAAGMPPASRELPVARELEGMTVTIQSVHRGGEFVDCKFMLTVPPGQLLRQGADLSSLRVHTGLLGLLPHPDPGPGYMWALEHWAGSRFHVQARFRTPRWSRTTDITVTVPRWPQQPLVSATVEVPEPAIRSESDQAQDTDTADRAHASVVSAEGLTITVENLGIITPEVPDIVALRVNFEYETAAESCCERASVRFTDERGTVLPTRPGPMSRRPGQMRGEVEIRPLPTEVKRLSLQLFTEEQLRDQQVTFRFRRMPIFDSPQVM